MIRSLKATSGGLGELTLRPEMPEELDELTRVCPHPMPAGVIHGFRWTAPPAEGGHLVLFAMPDPDYKPPVLSPPSSNNPAFQAVPKREQLVDWKKEDLITRAAELGVPHEPSDTKAMLAGKILIAWNKLNAELDQTKGPKA